MPRTTAELRTPAYVVRRSTLERNAAAMRERASKLGCALRPHVKTTKTLEGAALLTGGTRRRITVSTVAEAEFYAAGGFDDILLAVPLTPDKVGAAVQLADRLDTFHVMLDSLGGLEAMRPELDATAPAAPLSVVLMIDCGYGRDGADPADPDVLSLASSLAAGPHTRLGGVYTHAGHSYDTGGDADALAAVAAQERDAAVTAAVILRDAGLAVPFISIGSTPSCSRPPANLDGVDEMHAGNYAYYDTMQVRIGSCSVRDIAVRVLTRVVGHYPKRGKMLVDLGWTGVSAQGEHAGFGSFVEEPSLRMVKLKQEMGEVGPAEGCSPIDYARYPIGTILSFAPYHACAATQQHAAVHVLDDDGATVLDTWRICKGW